MGLQKCLYKENGEEKWFDNEAYVEELKNSHYSELKALIKRAMGIRTQVQFAADIDMSKEYLNRILKDGSDMIPSNKMLENISEKSADKSVTFKELLIAAGRTPACERLNTETRPRILTFDDMQTNDVYNLKKNLVELLIRERGKEISASPKEYLKNLMNEFIDECRYSFFDFECFANEGEYISSDDWGMDVRFGENRHTCDTVLMGCVTAAVRTKYEPDEWAKSKVTFAFFFSADEDDNEKLTIIDTDWDIPEWAMDQPALEKIEVDKAYSLKDFLDEVDEPAYTTDYEIEVLDGSKER
nr:hypothetical protein [uncultured Butyrivibrio sp.]